MATLLLLLVKCEKSQISWKLYEIEQFPANFFTCKVLQEYPVQTGKISIFATLAAIFDFSRK